MLRQLRPALVVAVALTVLCGIVYPLLVTGAAQVVFPHQADGSEVVVDGRVVASALVAQPFDGDEWFQPRPSAVGHDASSSGGSNLGPTNPELLEQIQTWSEEYRQRNGLAPGVAVPVDAVTMSGSGLDPHISPRNARLQAPRVADVRGIEVEEVLLLVDRHTEPRTFGVLGEPRVNVVDLNTALERLAR